MNTDDEIEEFIYVLKRHFTAAELVEFLDVDVDYVIEALQEDIFCNYEQLCEEIGYEYREDS